MEYPPYCEGYTWVSSLLNFIEALRLLLNALLLKQLKDGIQVAGLRKRPRVEKIRNYGV